jgi:GrpB-like predicted nucleotidyltransferase (UPF0157 family)
MVIALAATAAAALVQAMVTDGWEGVRHKVACLFGRGEPDAAIERRLDSTRAELTAAAPSQREAVRAALAVQWETRLGDLLADHPDAQSELAALVREMQVARQVVASDHAVAAGRDVNVTAWDGGVAATVIGGNVSLGQAPPGPTRAGPAGG